MSEHTNLETVDAYLASVILPQGNTLPAPLVVLSDDTPLYDEPAVLAEIENALAEDRAAKIDAEIVSLATYNTTLITVTFAGAGLAKTYRVNVPRQLMQVGYLYNRLLHAPACHLITESEVNLNRDFDTDDTHRGEFLPPFVSEDIMIRLRFPEDMPDETRRAYNFILHDLATDFTEGISKEEIREIAPKVHLVIDPVESRAIRGEIINLVLRLVEGKEDALAELYDYAEQVEKAKEVIGKNALLSDEERKALIVFEYVAKLVAFLNPNNLVANLREIEKAMAPKKAKEEASDESTPDLDSLFSDDDFASSLDEIVTEYRKENPNSITITEESTNAEREEYVSLPSNLVPLMGGLMKLSDRLNLDLYYSQNWNRDKISDEEYGTQGELLLILTILAIQRMYMYGKTIDMDVDDVQEAKGLALSLSIDALSQPTDIDVWYLKESLYRAGRGDNEGLRQFFYLSLDESEHLMHSYYGQVMHWMGHTFIEDGHKHEDVLKAFEGLPRMQEFANAIFADAETITEESEYETFDSEDVDSEDGEGVCFISSAVMDLFDEDAEEPEAEDLKVVTESVEALVRFAAMCLRKDQPGIREGSSEWKETLGIYLNRVLDD